MLRECKNCSKEFEGTARASFCSSTCRVAFHRNNVTEINVTEPVTVNVTELSKTDMLFQEDSVERGLGENWLVFGPIVRNPNCDECRKPFKTQLSMLKHCSPACRRSASIA